MMRGFLEVVWQALRPETPHWSIGRMPVGGREGVICGAGVGKRLVGHSCCTEDAEALPMISDV